MFISKWLWLQLFAEGGEGAATTGENAVDPGTARLLELGVPKDKIRPNRAKSHAPWMKQAAAAEKPKEQSKEQDAAAEQPPQETKEETPAKRKTFRELMEDPEYNQEMQKTMQSRLKTAKAAEESMGILEPALKVLAQKRGMDIQNLDYRALADSIMDDNAMYEARAMENGVPVEFQKEMDQAKQREAMATRQLQQLQEQQQEAQRQQQFVQHMNSMRQQAEALKAKYPSFNLDAEMQNPAFQRLTHPSVGLNVEQAYNAIHYREIQQAAKDAAEKQASEAIAANIQAGARRPAENGASGQAPSTTKFDYSKATPAERAAFKQFIRSEAAAGRKVYPR